ncbi:hypothetical protein ASTA108788_12355 [Asticcacaulis taihuensis]
MQLQGLKARPRRRGLPKDAGERSTAAPNVLDRQFAADKPNQKWVADFTYIWTAEGWLYFAAVIDLFSRRVIGWSMSTNMTAQLVTRGALDEAYFNMSLHGPIQYDPLTYGIKWYGRSRLLQNWASVKTEVYFDFGKSNLFRLLTYDPVKKVGTVGIVLKAALIEDLIHGRRMSGAAARQPS